ncbi:TIGR02611 family protein [Skermania sp. ID1734]|uniref:TIGR02611 family protein n=1 Tax=Skermania sp. ID1734 TaxID=2597516 RepID=UPI002105C4B9|nr:TIGR02611 family protein [Skermania sp. ID1734]
MSSDEQSVSRWAQQLRAKIAESPTLNLIYRIAIAVIGTAVLVVGIITVPYPGPGWLIVFAGLGILASEFEWAHRVLRWVRARYNRFMAWFAEQNVVVKGMGVLFTAVVVVATLWVLGTFGFIGRLAGVDWAWLQSPVGS